MNILELIDKYIRFSFKEATIIANKDFKQYQKSNILDKFDTNLATLYLKIEELLEIADHTVLEQCRAKLEKRISELTNFNDDITDKFKMDFYQYFLNEINAKLRKPKTA